jgi:hypothetical protein
LTLVVFDEQKLGVENVGRVDGNEAHVGLIEVAPRRRGHAYDQLVLLIEQVVFRLIVDFAE